MTGAAELIARGFSVIPAGRDKKPLIQWGEYQTRRASEDEVRSWDANGAHNIGIVTGSISGLAVIDADSREVVTWCEANLPLTPAVETARGRHYYFKFRPGLKNSVAVNGLKLDIRGEGGYVIGPGSVHETGVIYSWLEGRSLDDLPLAEFPSELFTKQSDKAKPSTTTPGKYGQAALASELSHLAGASEGTRNNALNEVAFSLGQLVSGGELDRGPVEAALIGTALSIGLSEAEARATIRSGLEAGSRDPRTAPESGRRESLTTGAPETETPGELKNNEQVQALKKVSLDDIEGVELPSPAYAVEPLTPEGEVTLLGGHGGAGKSILAMTICAHYAAKRFWFGYAVSGGRALYVSLEDPGTLAQYRLKKICEVYDLPIKAVIENLTILDGSEAEGALCAETNEYGVRNVSMTPLFDEVKEASKGCGLIIIDNASDAYGADENSRRQVRRFIRELRALARERDAGLILLAHVDKMAARNGAQGNTYSGSTAWHNSVRSRLALTEKNGAVELVQEKLNLGKKLDRAIRLTWHDGVLIPDGTIAEGLDAEGQEDMDKAAVLAAIQKAIADGVDVPTARTGPANCHGTLERLPDLPEHLRGRRGRDAFYRALTDLQRESTLQVEEYRTASRNIRQRFCVGSDALHIIPNTLCVEPTKLTQACSLVTGGASVTGTNETHETNAEEDLIL